MIQISEETETLALRVAAAWRLPVDEAIRLALQREAREIGAGPTGGRRRMSAGEMLAAGAAVAAAPLLDNRTPDGIMADVDVP